jgi:DNA-binding transcriptional ArsR family regulator
MLRMHFSADDLMRTRVATTWGPWAETVLCFGALRDRSPGAPFRPWRQSAGRATDHRWTALARYLRPLPGTVADMLTLVGAHDSFDSAREGLAAAPDAQLRQELSMFRLEYLPAWLIGLEQARPAARHTLAEMLELTHRRLIAPYWTAMLNHLGGQRSRLGRMLADHGVDYLLEHLHPGLRWRSPTLEVKDGAPWVKGAILDAQLSGRGVVIVPSVFCGRVPIPLFPISDGPALLLVPAPPDLVGAAELWNVRAATSDPLTGLLGRTRAAVLRTLDGGTTTSELAGRLGISVSGASQHASALRAAGLVSSSRDRNRMVHSVTDLGGQLLERTG